MHHQMPSLHCRRRQAARARLSTWGSSDQVLVNGGDHDRKTMRRQTELTVGRRMLKHKQLSVDFSSSGIFFSEDGAAGHFHQASEQTASWKKLCSFPGGDHYVSFLASRNFTTRLRIIHTLRDCGNHRW
jgi:hypothetical protein